MKTKLLLLCFIVLNNFAMQKKIKMDEMLQVPKNLAPLLDEGTHFSFVDLTTIVKRLAGKLATPETIAREIETSIDEYRAFKRKFLRGHDLEFAVETAKNDLYNIFEIIFKDHPEYLPELKKRGFKYAVDDRPPLSPAE